MILRALYDYYHRSQNELAPEGMELKEIPFVLVLDTEGRLLHIEDHRKADKTVQRFMVVKGARSGTTPKPYLFWDNVEYVLNYTKTHEPLPAEVADDEAEVAKRNEAIRKTARKHEAMVNLYHEIAAQHPDNAGFRAVCRFYADGHVDDVVNDPLWEAIRKKPTVNLSFRLEGEPRLVAEDVALRPAAETDGNDATAEAGAVCLVTGKRGSVVETTTATPIAGGQATARLVAFQVNSGYDSYGKSKCHNAPISPEAEAAYTTALNHLLAKDSRNKFTIGNRTFVFWASSHSEAAKAAEDCYADLFNLVVADDDSDSGVEQVQKVFEAIYSGHLKTDLDDRFYILGLAPNSARIAVVYWEEIALKTFAGRLLQHFDDMAIVDTRAVVKPYRGLRQMMSAVTLGGKVSEVQPNLPETVMQSIHSGTPYPYALLTACLRRIRAEQQMTITRAAILKAYINRIPSNSKSITVMLDKDNTNIGYLCGRLFAALERIQEKSNNNNSNIRSRYMNGASATPAAVFPTLLNLSVHHSDKLDGSWQTHFERLKGEIIDAMPADGFPAHLPLEDQGRFMVGYYQQRQDFFRKKDETQE